MLIALPVQIFRDNFCSHERSTLAVVCLPLGSWVGGMFTAFCTRCVLFCLQCVTSVASQASARKAHVGVLLSNSTLYFLMGRHLRGQCNEQALTLAAVNITLTGLFAR